ncbi:hypothetical protein [Paraburkholderia jirisanensis]
MWLADTTSGFARRRARLRYVRGRRIADRQWRSLTRQTIGIRRPIGRNGIIGVVIRQRRISRLRTVQLAAVRPTCCPVRIRIQRRRDRPGGGIVQ